jgi:hypothetical protein
MSAPTHPAVRARATEIGVPMSASTSEEFRAEIEVDLRTWSEVIRVAGIERQWHASIAGKVEQARREWRGPHRRRLARNAMIARPDAIRAQWPRRRTEVLMPGVIGLRPSSSGGSVRRVLGSALA